LQVTRALAALHEARRHITAGAYAAAAASASAAHAAAEAALSHPAVLTQLNFPESHKLGVYMPLFLPLAVPLLQGVGLQVWHYMQRRRGAVQT
jgi:phosphatidylinositol glycan class S